MPTLRFVFPHAPVRPVTINNGYQMRAWYDIIGIDRRSAEDFAGIAASAEAIGDLIKAENQRGVATERIAIAGFSQGGAMALHIATRHPEKFAGVIALSCYLPQARELATARSAANQATPIFMAHGTQDPVVPYPLGDESRRLLEGAGYPVEWHAYPMPHALCEPEVADMRAGSNACVVASARLSSYRQMFTVAATFSDSMAPVPGIVNAFAPSALICSCGRPRASLPKT